MLKKLLITTFIGTLTPTLLHADFVRGDLTGDQLVNNADLTALQQYVGTGSHANVRCPDKADVNDDGQIDTSDITYLQNFLLSAGPAPRAPFPNAGHDRTADRFLCGECVIAGGNTTTGSLYRLADPYVLPQLIAQGSQLQGVTGITVLNNELIGAVGKNATGSMISLVHSQGAITPILNGPVFGFFGPNPQEVTAFGGTFDLIVFAEGAATGGFANRIFGLGGMPLTTLAQPPLPVKAIRFDNQGNLAVASGNARSFSTQIAKLDHTLQLTPLCSIPLGEPTDLVVDSISNDYIYTLNDSWPNDQVRRCTQSGGNQLVIDQITLNIGANDNIVTVEQLPSAIHNRNYIVGVQDGAIGKLFNVSRSQVGQRTNLTSFPINQMEDMVCVSDD